MDRNQLEKLSASVQERVSRLRLAQSSRPQREISGQKWSDWNDFKNFDNWNDKSHWVKY